MGRPARKARDPPTEADCEIARKYNPQGVLAIEYGMKGSHFYKCMGLVAGYLKNCHTTKQLHAITNSLSDLFKQYDSIRRNDLEVATVPCSDLFGFLIVCEKSPMFSALVNEEKIPSEDDIITVDGGTADYIAPLITSNILVKVINRIPQHFSEVYKYSPAQSKYLPLFEDLHRAYALLRMWYFLDAENKKGRRPWAPSRPSSRSAEVIHYLGKYVPSSKDSSGLKEKYYTTFSAMKQVKMEVDDDHPFQIFTRDSNVPKYPVDITRATRGVFHHPGIPVISQKEADLLDIDLDRLPIPLNWSRRSVLRVATMLREERIAWSDRLESLPTLQARILSYENGSNRKLEILALLHLSYKFGIQDMGKVVKPMKPTLVCIQPAASSSWWLDYIQHFAFRLNIFFVGECFTNSDIPQKNRISVDLFHQAMLEPEESDLFPTRNDRGRTVFVVYHSILKDYTVEPLIKKETDWESTPGRDGITVLNNILTEAEDPELQAETAKFDAFLVNHSCQFAEKFYRIVVDEANVARRTTPDIMPVVSLLKPDFTWLVTETPQLDEIRDFYSYTHILYDYEQELDISEDFLEKSTLQKFKSAETSDEHLELFNPLNIRRLSVNGYIKSEVVERTIPALLRKCMIRATSEVDRKRKREEDMQDIVVIKQEL